jgi:hypothetical protein
VHELSVDGIYGLAVNADASCPSAIAPALSPAMARDAALHNEKRPAPEGTAVLIRRGQ